MKAEWTNSDSLTTSQTTKAVLVIEIPNKYADRYNVNEMYVWGLTVQDKHGYEMFNLVTDEPSHLTPLPEKKQIKNVSVFEDKIKAILNDDALERNIYRLYWYKGFNECLDQITGETE